MLGSSFIKLGRSTYRFDEIPVFCPVFAIRTLVVGFVFHSWPYNSERVFLEVCW